jgi:two-component system, cell cycle sensor histidine kinase and response regulator CckA
VQIYVVDDDPTILEVTHTLLEIHGYRVAAFQSPEDALKAYAAAKPRPRLLLTDYVMPGMNGMELIDRCREVEPQLRSVMMSGSVGEEVFRGSSSKPDQFLRKPFLAAQLVACVQAALGES